MLYSTRSSFIFFGCECVIRVLKTKRRRSSICLFYWRQDSNWTISSDESLNSDASHNRFASPMQAIWCKISERSHSKCNWLSADYVSSIYREERSPRSWDTRMGIVRTIPNWKLLFFRVWKIVGKNYRNGEKFLLRDSTSHFWFPYHAFIFHNWIQLNR